MSKKWPPGATCNSSNRTPPSPLSDAPFLLYLRCEQRLICLPNVTSRSHGPKLHQYRSCFPTFHCRGSSCHEEGQSKVSPPSPPSSLPRTHRCKEHEAKACRWEGKDSSRPEGRRFWQLRRPGVVDRGGARGPVTPGAFQQHSALWRDQTCVFILM